MEGKEKRIQEATSLQVKKRYRRSNEDKLNIIALTKEAGATFASVSRATGIPQSSIRKWAKEELRLQNLSEEAKKGKSNYPDLYPTLTLLLSAWVDKVLATSNLSINTFSIQNQAVKFKKEILTSTHEQITKKEKENLEKFTASEKWARKWANTRGDLCMKILHGEGGSVDMEKTKKEIENLQTIIAEYEAENVYNMDETGLFYRQLPNFCYVKKSQKKEARGKKTMKAKDRVSLYIATNMTGTQKVPLGIIGTAKHPRCFKGRKKLPLTYFAQKNAWSDRETYKKWFFSLFLPHVRKTTTKKVLLIMDNCGPHSNTALDFKEQVQIVFLPPGCTSKHQPMDQGIISWLKRAYKKQLLEEMLDVFERKEEIKKIPKVAGCAGILDGEKANLLDAMKILKKSWDDLEQTTIARCWKKSDLLPPNLIPNFNNMHGKVHGTVDFLLEADIQDCTEKIKGLEVSPAENEHGFGKKMPEQDIKMMLREWMNLENSVEIKEWEEQEKQQFIEEEISLSNILLPHIQQKEHMSDDSCTGKSSNQECEEEENKKLPTQLNYAAIAEQLVNIQNTLEQHNLSSAAQHLGDVRAEIFRATRPPQKEKKVKQTNMNMFVKKVKK